MRKLNLEELPLISGGITSPDAFRAGMHGENPDYIPAVFIGVAIAMLGNVLAFTQIQTKFFVPIFITSMAISVGTSIYGISLINADYQAGVNYVLNRP